MTRLAQRGLFGGAIVADLPANVLDVSDLRQVPDNQEVFLYPDSNASLVVEVLQRVQESIDTEAVKLHFKALAHDNDADSSTMQSPIVIDSDREGQTPSPVVLRGSQSIRKFNSITADVVDIHIALFRVHSRGKNADLVVSASIPRGPEGGVGEECADDIASEFNSLVSSLRIIDYDLFADSMLPESSHLPCK